MCHYRPPLNVKKSNTFFIYLHSSFDLKFYEVNFIFSLCFSIAEFPHDVDKPTDRKIQIFRFRWSSTLLG